MPIMLVDDEIHTLNGYEAELLAEGLGESISCRSGAEALGQLARKDISLILLDLRMPGMPGEEVLATLTRLRPDIPVIVITAVNDMATAVRCMKAGAFDYLLKPIDRQRLLSSLRKALEFGELRQENARLSEALLEGRLRKPEAFAGIVTRDPKMRSLFTYVESIALTSQPVLISGETGVGKELFAQAVHASSLRSGTIVSVNIAGLDEEAFADTLFGHRRGAFTGAERDREGLIEKAENGTLFLDEIGDLSAHSQVRLLRLMQEREYYPLGADIPRKSSARVVTATNRDLEAAAGAGSFRADLYYRLYLHHIRVPPLRERREDIPLLTQRFLREACAELGIEPLALDPDIEALLQGYAFPGNVRELHALVYDALSRRGSDSRPFDSIRQLLGGRAESEPREAQAELPKNGNPFAAVELLPTLEEAEELLIDEAMTRTAGNRTRAGEMLKITRQTILRKFKKRNTEG